jgi:hypothetical protein
MERIAAPIATIERDHRASRSLATPPNAFMPRPSAFLAVQTPLITAPR